MATLFLTQDRVPDFTEYLESGTYTSSATRALASGPAPALSEYRDRYHDAAFPPGGVPGIDLHIELSGAEERRALQAAEAPRRREARERCAAEGRTWRPEAPAGGPDDSPELPF